MSAFKKWSVFVSIFFLNSLPFLVFVFLLVKAQKDCLQLLLVIFLLYFFILFYKAENLTSFLEKPQVIIFVIKSYRRKRFGEFSVGKVKIYIEVSFKCHKQIRIVVFLCIVRNVMGYGAVYVWSDRYLLDHFLSLLHLAYFIFLVDNDF